MDAFTSQHLDRWIAQTCNADFRDERRALMVGFLADYPTLIDEGRSWPEILALAERRAFGFAITQWVRP